MAVSFTNKLQNGNTANAASYNTASHTPTANKLQLLWVNNSGSTTPTVTGNGLTWVQVATVLQAAISRRLTLFRALGPTPSAGASTIDFGGVAQGNCSWVLVEYDGMDTSGTNGSGSVVQSNTNSADTGTTPTVTLGAFSSVNNATSGGIAVGINSALDPAMGSGFSNSGRFGQGSPNATIATEFLATNDTSVDWAYTANAHWYSIALEIKAASAGPTGQLKTKISGTISAKPIKTKISGTVVTKPMKYKSGGVIYTNPY